MIPAFDHAGPFIWAAYGLSALVLACMVAGALARASAARRRLEDAEEEARR